MAADLFIVNAGSTVTRTDRFVSGLTAAVLAMGVPNPPRGAFEMDRPRGRRIIPSRDQSPRIRGNLRNKPCPCGSGKKRKHCGCADSLHRS